jgi:MtN3 and saliva related transmembrane protein
MIFVLCQLIGGLILTIGTIPQIVQLIKTKSATDLNHITAISVFGGILMMEIYAINLLLEGIGVAFFITNTVSLLLQATSAGLILKYKRVA